MRAVQQEIIVQTREGRPVSVTWQGYRYPVVQLLDSWRYGGRWWLGEAPRDCYLVRCGPLTAELHHDAGPLDTWWLARIQD